MKRSILNFTFLFLLDNKIEILLKHVDRLKLFDIFVRLQKFSEFFKSRSSPFLK